MRFPLQSLLVPGLLLAAPSLLSAHCDALDGPVVKAARSALETGSPDAVLAWVRPADEAIVRQAFARTLAVRKLGPEAKEMADLYFFETVVRIHRAGEGAPYTGLKPAGQDLGPAIPAADQALASGDLGPVLRLLRESSEEGLKRRFHQALHTRDHNASDLAAGRARVAAYVDFLHYVDGLHRAAMVGGDSEEHHHE